MSRFTQEEIDEVLNETFSVPGIFELASVKGRWRAFCGEASGGSDYYEYIDHATPAEAVRAARAVMVARKLMK